MVARPVSDGCSTFGLELCVCSRCNALLTRYDFRFDWLGRTIEHCPKCGPQLLAVRHGAPPPQPHRHPKPKMMKGCADCKGWMLWSGTGGKPVRCVECQQRHQRAENRQYQRDVSAGRRVAVPRKMLA